MTKKKKTCNQEGCDKPAVSFGMCVMHYKRQQRHGSPDVVIDLAKSERRQEQQEEKKARPNALHQSKIASDTSRLVRHYRNLGTELTAERVWALADLALHWGRPEFLLDLSAAARVLHARLLGRAEVPEAEES